jgi:hypothetical protein
MPYLYSRRFKRFLTRSGTPVSRLAVRDEVDKLIRHVGNESQKLANKFLQNRLTLQQFETQTSELLKAGHITAASIGRGGIGRMSQKDWEAVGAKIAWQNDYLSRFAKRIEAGTVSPRMTNYRAGLYADALFTSFSNTFFKEGKSDIPEGKNAERCKLKTNSIEGCKECAADEARGWISVDDMKPIGTRICGDFCKCDIIFENDDDPIPDFEIKVDVTDDAKAPAPTAYGKASFKQEIQTGEGFTAEELIKYARIAGIPEEFDAEITVKRPFGGNRVEVRAVAPGELHMLREINVGTKTIENSYFKIKNKDKYNGTQIFAKQVESAASEGYGKIVTDAVREEGANGYYTWLRLGYQARKKTLFHNEIIAEYGKLTGVKLKDISDFMATKQGQDFWKERGKGFTGIFTLKEGSKSRKILDAYLKQRGFK